jgi:preprotein translocase subunit SecG
MNVLTIIQLILALVLITIVLLQQQGTGLGGAFGGEGNVYRSRRGVEKFLFLATIFVGIAFFSIAVATILTTNR